MIILQECHINLYCKEYEEGYTSFPKGNAHEGERQKKKEREKEKTIPFLGNSSLNRISFDTYQLIDNYRRSLHSTLVTHRNEFFLLQEGIENELTFAHLVVGQKHKSKLYFLHINECRYCHLLQRPPSRPTLITHKLTLDKIRLNRISKRDTIIILTHYSNRWSAKGLHNAGLCVSVDDDGGDNGVSMGRGEARRRRRGGRGGQKGSETGPGLGSGSGEGLQRGRGHRRIVERERKRKEVVVVAKLRRWFVY